MILLIYAPRKWINLLQTSALENLYRDAKKLVLDKAETFLLCEQHGWHKFDLILA